MSDMQSTGHHRRRALLSKAFAFICLVATSLCVLILLLLLIEIMWQGLPWLNLRFLTSYASRFPEKA